MVALETPEATRGVKAKYFNLLGTDGKFHNIFSVLQEGGLVVAFICNHCPYVKAIANDIVWNAEQLARLKVGFVAINPNDTDAYPEDSYDLMKEFASHYQFPFPYLIDSSQEVARSYEAVCTPDFFGFNADLSLQYRGGLKVSNKTTIMPGISNPKHELLAAMEEVAITGKFTGQVTHSIGCSIKWKLANNT